MLIVLAGNPNAGKTTLFNYLTHSNLRTGNFHGVTTAATRKKCGKNVFSDAPGLYSLSAYSMEEQEAAKEISAADLVVNVVDALTLENSLSLTRELISSGKRVVVYVTKTRALKRRGGFIDAKKLSSILGAPVCDMPPSKFKKLLSDGGFAPVIKREMPLDEAYVGGNCKLSRADKLFYNRFFALIFFVAAIIFMFFFAFFPGMPGALLKGLTQRGLNSLCALITGKMRNEAVISLLEEGVFGGAGGVISFIPQLAFLYMFLTLLDESGITSALSFCTDGLFAKVNLSGRAAFTLVSGFGCTSAAIATTRGYVSRSARRRTIFVLPYIPCSAKLPVFLTFLSPVFENPFPPLVALYFCGVGLSLLFSVLLKGGKEGLLYEVAPVFFPSFKAVTIKLYFYLKGFIIKVTGIVTAFCVLSWFLSHFSPGFCYVAPEESILSRISGFLLPLFRPMGVDDWRIAYAALCGIIAKENVAAAVGMLMPLGAGLTTGAALALCVFILACPACVSAFAASVREEGCKFTLQCVLFQTLIAFLASYAVYFVSSL